MKSGSPAKIARRSDVVGIYPNRAALRLVSALLVDVNNEWLVAHRYFSLGSLAPLDEPGGGPDGPAGAGRPGLLGRAGQRRIGRRGARREVGHAP